MSTQFVDFGRQCLAWASSHGPDLLSRVVSALVILFAGIVVIGILKRTLKASLARMESDRKLAAHFTASIVCKTAWAFLILVVLARLGVEIGPLVAGLGVTGFVLGFAFQESLGSLASGFMIAFNHPFKTGDHVLIAGHEGTVIALDMMAVTLQADDGRRITIPNKSVWGGPIVNMTAVKA